MRKTRLSVVLVAVMLSASLVTSFSGSVSAAVPKVTYTDDPVLVKPSYTNTATRREENEEKIPAPKNIKYTSTSDSITIKWDKINGVTGYRIYWDAGIENKNFPQKTREVKDTSCTFTDLAPDTTYYFKIGAYDATVNDSAIKKNKNYKAKVYRGIGEYTESIEIKTKSLGSDIKASDKNITGFYEKGKKKYYYKNGKQVSGFVKTSKGTYYFDKKSIL